MLHTILSIIHLCKPSTRFPPFYRILLSRHISSVSRFHIPLSLLLFPSIHVHPTLFYTLSSAVLMLATLLCFFPPISTLDPSIRRHHTDRDYGEFHSGRPPDDIISYHYGHNTRSNASKYGELHCINMNSDVAPRNQPIYGSTSPVKVVSIDDYRTLVIGSKKHYNTYQVMIFVLLNMIRPRMHTHTITETQGRAQLVFQYEEFYIQDKLTIILFIEVTRRRQSENNHAQRQQGSCGRHSCN